MEVSLAINSKLSCLPESPMDTGLLELEYYAEGIKFIHAWNVEAGSVVVKLTDKNKYTDKMVQELGNIKGQLGVVLGVKCSLLDNAHPSATTVDGFLWDRSNGLMKRIVEIVGQNPGGDITFHWLNENLIVKGLNKVPTDLPGNHDGALWVAQVPDAYWRVIPRRLFKLLSGVVGEIHHDSFSITIRLVFE